MFGGASKSGAALQGFAQGASAGFVDELAGSAKGLIAGFTRAGVEGLKSGPGRLLVRNYLGLPAEAPDQAVDAVIERAFQEGAKSTLFDKRIPTDPNAALERGYREGRDESRLLSLQGKTAHPYIHGAAQIAGAVASPGPKAPGVRGLAKASALAKQGAAYGAAAGVGGSNADLTRDGSGFESVADAAMGAAAGGVLAPAAGVGSERAAGWLRRAAQDNALKAIGVRGGIGSQLGNRGYATADDARRLGQAALDMELIRPFRTVEDVAEGASMAKERQGARIEQALADADATGATFDADRAAWSAAGEVMGADGLSPTAIREGGRARKLIEDTLALPRVQESSFRNANRLKSDMQSGINYATDPALKTKLERRAASGLRQSIEEQIAESAGPEVADELRAANHAYGFLSDIEPLAQEESRRMLERQTPWPSAIRNAFMAGGAGAAGGGVTGGAVPGAVTGAAGFIAPLAARAIGPRLPSTMAVMQQAMGRSPRSALGSLAQPAIQSPARPSRTEEEEDAITAFLNGG